MPVLSPGISKFSGKENLRTFGCEKIYDYINLKNTLCSSSSIQKRMTVPAQYVTNVRRTGSEITGKRLSSPTSTGISSSSLPSSKSGYVRSKKGFGKSTYHIIDVLWGQSIKQNQVALFQSLKLLYFLR